MPKGFCGADIEAAISTARIELTRAKQKVLTKGALLQALRSTKSSLNERDIAQNEQVLAPYRTVKDGEGGAKKGRIHFDKMGKRAALA